MFGKKRSKRIEAMLIALCEKEKINVDVVLSKSIGGGGIKPPRKPRP